jgi:hypothetical protein
MDNLKHNIINNRHWIKKEHWNRESIQMWSEQPGSFHGRGKFYSSLPCQDQLLVQHFTYKLAKDEAIHSSSPKASEPHIHLQLAE